MRRVAGGGENTLSYLKADHSWDSEMELCLANAKKMQFLYCKGELQINMVCDPLHWFQYGLHPSCAGNASMVQRKVCTFTLFEEWDQEHRLSLSTSNIKCHSEQSVYRPFTRRPNGPSGTFSKMAWGHLQYYKCNKTHPQKSLQICQKHIYMGSSAIK